MPKRADLSCLPERAYRFAAWLSILSCNKNTIVTGYILHSSAGICKENGRKTENSEAGQKPSASAKAPAQTGAEESGEYQTLKPGSKGQAVLDARMKLYELGYFKKKPTQKEFTNNMQDYVKNFEKDYGLTQDGILSPEDQEILFSL